MPDFDKEKTPLEKKLEHVANILATTHPEQTSDAMDDYAKALRILGDSKDYRIQLLIEQLKRLYVYPNRKEHKDMLIELYDVKESLHENHMDKLLAKNPKLNLGEETVKSKQWLWILVASITILCWLNNQQP